MTNTEHEKQYRVLVSYRSSDKKFASKLVNLLKQVGIESLKEGELTLEESRLQDLAEKVKKCNAVLVLFGAKSLGRWDEADIEQAYDRVIDGQTPLIPVLLPNGPEHASLPLLCQQVPVLDFHEADMEKQLQLLQVLYWGITGENKKNGN